MALDTKVMLNLGKAFKFKSVGILFLGVLLMIVSMLVNVLKEGVGNIGIAFSELIIIFAIIFTAITKYYWIKEEREKLQAIRKEQ